MSIKKAVKLLTAFKKNYLFKSSFFLTFRNFIFDHLPLFLTFELYLVSELST